ncbi:hypothetical protein CQW23_16022 [Capsicum baccatum]|uniref:Rad21/Rec8-like protein C-terminal eukaryotic domain-containing protein n=1 Tax=Capsicum baccatum TaxID=33114 RepID=A0A2G2WNP3_CAPBA|nr:hypothetical protein CQW23_16022 [Capsicum baccatum]
MKTAPGNWVHAIGRASHANRAMLLPQSRKKWHNFSLQVQINEAWKVKATVDPTLLPKGKSQAKHASVTLPENQEEEPPEIEQMLRNPDTVTMMDFEQTSYFEMRLDNADIYDKPNAGEERAPDLHQVDAENITLLEHFESGHTDMFNHFDRFDIEGDDDTQMNFTQPEDAQIPSTPVPSAPKEQAHKRGIGSPSKGISVEKQRANLNNFEIPPEILMENLRDNLTNMGLRPTEADGVKETGHMATPGSGDEPRSIPSSGSGHGLLSQNSITNSRSNKKRPHSSSKHSGNGLQPVAEENPWHDPTPNFKLTRLSELSENGVTQDNEILMETGPTQTQRPFVTQPLDMVTDTIRKQLKSHFDTPGSAETECLNELTLGLTKKQAARLFYQTCVLATRDFIKVQQEVPYGNILISRGAKM